MNFMSVYANIYNRTSPISKFFNIDAKFSINFEHPKISLVWLII